MQDYHRTAADLLTIPSVFCCFFLQRDQGKEFSISTSFGSDQQQVPRRSQGEIWGLWSLLAACLCQSLCSYL